jgi:DNA mismatch repair ATPase MutS
LFWHIRYGRLVEKWSVTEKSHINKWFLAMGRFDAFVSMSGFAYNHPGYNYPEIAPNFIFEAKALGHPLINRKTCVKNDVYIPKRSFFLVVTGANMAGKSTYLRTVGLNHIIGAMGMPVCADSLVFSPIQLVTNLRTADSLADNESYFFAELKRLKMIIDRLQSGEELFIVLDEILKGTNSEDKQKGSLALMKQLISLQANGIIATHDLVLGTLEKEYPANIKNYRFEADIENENLSFTYKIREGIAQNMNASFLMRKMGITGI